MERTRRTFFVVGIVALLAAAGFVAAAQVADVAILPMPGMEGAVKSEAEPPGEEAGSADVEHGAEDGAVALERGAGDVGERSAAEDAEAIGGEPEARAGVEDVAPGGGPETGDSDEAVASDDDVAAGDTEVVPALPDVEPEWSAEEIEALRELARERIAAKQLMDDFVGYFHALWDEEVAPWLKSQRREHAPMLDSVEQWLGEGRLPDKGEMAEQWDRIVERITESTGIAIEDAKEIGEEWLDAQRELVEELMEELTELRQELQEGRNEVDEPAA